MLMRYVLQTPQVIYFCNFNRDFPSWISYLVWKMQLIVVTGHHTHFKRMWKDSIDFLSSYTDALLIGLLLKVVELTYSKKYSIFFALPFGFFGSNISFVKGLPPVVHIVNYCRAIYFNHYELLAFAALYDDLSDFTNTVNSVMLL